MFSALHTFPCLACSKSSKHIQYTQVNVYCVAYSGIEASAGKHHNGFKVLHKNRSVKVGAAENQRHGNVEDGLRGSGHKPRPIPAPLQPADAATSQCPFPATVNSIGPPICHANTKRKAINRESCGGDVHAHTHVRAYRVPGLKQAAQVRLSKAFVGKEWGDFIRCRHV